MTTSRIMCDVAPARLRKRIGLALFFLSLAMVAIVLIAAFGPKEVRRPDIAPNGPMPRQRGVALGLFAEDLSFSYRALLREIAELGASHVALVIPLYQEHGSSTEIFQHTRFSPTLEVVANSVREAQREGLSVTLFPIVRLLSPRTPDEWRGTLTPSDRAAWFSSYGDHLCNLAALATLTGATRLVIGSELSSLDADLASWRPLIERVRRLFSGTLVYSANWDHYKKAALLDWVDEAGITGYFSLRQADAPSDIAVLTARWRQLRAELEAWIGPRRQPLVFTEIGYRSRAGSTVEPWNEAPGGIPSPDEQARAFESFRQVWSGAASLAGYYVWNWYGFGGPETTSYTPRGKPAEAIVRRLLSTP